MHCSDIGFHENTDYDNQYRQTIGATSKLILVLSVLSVLTCLSVLPVLLTPTTSPTHPPNLTVGRTHQIRVHCSGVGGGGTGGCSGAGSSRRRRASTGTGTWMGCPLLGDGVYGGALQAVNVLGEGRGTDTNAKSAITCSNVHPEARKVLFGRSN